MNRCKATVVIVKFLLLQILGISSAGESEVISPVYFSLIVSSAPTLNTSGIVSEVDRALELIRRDANILPGYRLQYSRVLDTQVRPCTSLEAAHCTDKGGHIDKAYQACMSAGGGVELGSQ